MQTGWERRHPLHRLSRRAVAQRLQPLFNGAAIESAELLPGGLRNTNYGVHLAGRPAPVVLRLYTADPAACARELALSHLVQTRVPVPDFLYADPLAAPPYAVMTWLEGIKLDQALLTAEAGAVEAMAFASGATLAHIHAFTFPVAGFFGPELQIVEPFRTGGEGWAGYLEQLLFHGRAGPRLGARLTHRLWRLAQACAPQLDPLRDDRSLVHADFKPWNLLVRPADQGWAVGGVLDWEFAFAGPPLLDVAIFLRHEADLPPPYREGFVAGYQHAGGSLPSDWRALASLLDLLNLCSMLDHPRGGPALVREVRGLVQQAVDAWEASPQG